ncbi:MAG: hypothetical protein IIC36_04660 [Gemmatimonadetes bacterium]|nr:hypothetical protein [Gemmatimonadota bacterium]
MLFRRTSEVALSYRSHYLPRSRSGWIAVLAFLGLMALVQPPIVFWVDTHLGSGWVLGMPFLYVYLGAVYFLLIGVLIWAVLRAV